MGRFTEFNINKPLLESFKEVFNNRIEKPQNKKPFGIAKIIEPQEKLSFVEWKNYINSQLRIEKIL